MQGQVGSMPGCCFNTEKSALAWIIRFSSLDLGPALYFKITGLYKTGNQQIVERRKVRLQTRPDGSENLVTLFLEFRSKFCRLGLSFV